MPKKRFDILSKWKIITEVFCEACHKCSLCKSSVEEKRKVVFNRSRPAREQITNESDNE